MITGVPGFICQNCTSKAAVTSSAFARLKLVSARIGMATADGCQRAEEKRAVSFQPLDRRLLADSLLAESCQRLRRLRMGYAADRGGCESEMLRRL